MFKYILSFFGFSEPELSLEECRKILLQEPEVLAVTNNCDNELEQENCIEGYCSIAKGTITSRKGNEYTINNTFSISLDTNELEEGMTVSYKKVIHEGQIDIYDVKIVDNWDNPTERESLIFNRILISKVERRNKRILYLAPEDIKVDLDKVSIDFIPIVGDWLELDVKCTTNKDSIDLYGELICINKISPVRLHIVVGSITTWHDSEHTGVINRNIFFNNEAIYYGYNPVIDDKVIAEIIESEQGGCGWRALKIIPESIHAKIESITASSKKQVETSHEGLEISNRYLHFEMLGEKKDFIINIKNVSNDTFTFLNADLNEECQQLILSKENPKCVKILPNESVQLTIHAIAMNIGDTNEFVVLNFDDFIIGQYIKISVNLQLQNDSGTYQKKNYRYRNNRVPNGHVIRGQMNTNRFAVKLPAYTLPKHLLDLVSSFSDDNDLQLIQELKKTRKSLFNDLCYMNYEDKFHALLHMDEISYMIHIRQYDQDRACFIPNREFLMLEIDNLAERKPSIVLGDRIQAFDPLKRVNHVYDGTVVKVGAKHVYLKFANIFHENYNGEDYAIQVVPGRSAYRRQHHAIYLVTRNLGKPWLFPDKIEEKPPQLDFWFYPYPNVIELTQKPLRLRRNVQEMRNLVKNARMKKELEESNANIPKLEWFNPTLNCKQKDAVVNIIKGVCRPLPYIVFGPPGTGKTVTLIESIMQVLRMVPGSRILVASPSNSAADLIALRLIGTGVLKPGYLVRLVSVNYAVGEQIPDALIPYCATGSSAREDTAEVNLRGANGILLDCSRKVLGRHRITVSTCSSAAVLHMMNFPRGHFTHIFVDEAGQAAEPEVLIPLSFLDKNTGHAVLAGDPMQLGPVIISRIAKSCGLDHSFLERMVNRFPYIRDVESFQETGGYDPRLLTKLLYNYRSMDVILELFSSLFYNGELLPTISNEDSRESRILNSMEEILPKAKDGSVPKMVFHGVKGQNFQTPDSPSWYNPHEAAQIFFYLNQLYRVGLKAENVGIITPYTKQVREIRRLLWEADLDVPKIGTVEDFQGQEFDVILLSTVRSVNEFMNYDLHYGLGFVSCPKRLNVAISRAKALLVIVGNPVFLKQDPHWRSVIDYCLDKGAYVGCSLSD